MVKRTSLNLELELVAEAREILGTRGTTDTVRRALEEVVRQEKLRSLAEWTFEHVTDADRAELERWGSVQVDGRS